MQKQSKRFILVICLTIAAGVLVAWHGFEPPLENTRFFDFPMETKGWKGEDIPMSSYVYQGIETKYLFLRNYYSNAYNQPVNLSIVWFDDRNLAFHTPEYCLGGVGITVGGKGTAKLKINGKEQNVGKMVADLNGRKELVLYYFDVDGNITTSISMIRVYTLLRRLTFRRSSASFVRLMTPIIDNNELFAANQINDFMDAIGPQLPEYTYTDMITKKN